MKITAPNSASGTDPDRTMKGTCNGLVLDRRHHAERHELVVGSAHINAFQLLRIQPVNALDLRDHFVTAALNVETIHVVSTNARRQISADLLHVEPERRYFVVIKHDLRLRLVDFRVNVRKSENAGLHRFHLELLRELEDALRIGSRSDHKAHRETVAAGKR